MFYSFEKEYQKNIMVVFFFFLVFFIIIFFFSNDQILKFILQSSLHFLLSIIKKQQHFFYACGQCFVNKNSKSMIEKSKQANLLANQQTTIHLAIQYI